MSENAPAAPTTYAVADCGGTHTRLEIWREGELVLADLLGSANTASRSAAEARGVYDRVVGHLTAHQGEGLEAVVATAGFDDASADALAAVFAELAAAHGFRGRIHLVNDVIPLLFPAERGRESVAAIIGTGSAFWARDARDDLVRIGGVEWLGSDEGAAMDLGKRALVAMVRAADGRADATAIAARAGLTDESVLQVARALGEDPHPKQRLAGLARAVTAAWVEDGDAVAAGIVAAAVADVEVSLATTARHLDDPAAATWIFGGGLVSGSLPYQRLVLEACARASGGATDVRVVENALELLRTFAARGWAQRVPPRFVRTIAR